jgi:hypothetical protein
MNKSFSASSTLLPNSPTNSEITDLDHDDDPEDALSDQVFFLNFIFLRFAF